MTSDREVVRKSWMTMTTRFNFRNTTGYVADNDYREVAELIVKRLNGLMVENYEPPLCEAYERFVVDAITQALTTARRPTD